jgi:hypothetical protein
MKFTLLSLLCVAMTTSVLCQDVEVIVYDNTNGDLDTRLNAGNFEIGDEIILARSERFPTSFTFQYYGENFTGDEELRVRFYKNDGPATLSGALTPGTIIFDTGFFLIPGSPRQVLIFEDFVSNAVVPLTAPLPDSFTWSVQFFLGSGTPTAGVDLFSPPTVGNNYPDYWENDGSAWTLRSGPVPIDFGARITAVPEPRLAPVALLAVAGFLIYRRRQKHV